ncbi:hypothetical protein TVAG_088460 [Trichomonas vaginalis G3]|uniref:Uncharacterized protein n=1 Tax=Trichomonas vaginalis (strain ATCC PRA-98 / G3) TaxID=412133 RepID=A2EAZ1_TRIV3|nr:spectrin binding [Trichomonas vaginalis G3]EAY10131.1 hypothetical protein TVAG_088460 [Trichomonas vaginalis G3]KAI5534493.1 spectrin binding [Trichomonas vaginalis G3]|eukprot:XP_001322354.1 hypothetical protein [Trichomonas vaginalis G3]
MLDQHFSFDDLKGPKSRTLLHYFALEKKTYDYDLLFKSFVRYNHTDDDRNTAIHLVQTPKFLRELLQHGVSHLIKNNDGHTPVDVLLLHDRDDLLIELINFLPSWVSENFSLLINTCIEFGSYKCFQYFADHHSKQFIEVFNKSSHSFKLIISNSNKYMLDIVYKLVKIPINQIPWNPFPSKVMMESILSHYVVQNLREFDIKSVPYHRNKEYLQKIIEEHINWTELNSAILKTPLHNTLMYSQDGYIENLRINKVDLLDYNGKTPLFLATECSSEKVAKHFVKHGAVGTYICCGSTPLHEAAKRNLKSVVEIIVHSRNNIDILDKNGLSPLFCAIESKSDDSAVILLNSGARVDLKTKSGDTILHFAAKNNSSPEILKKLLEKGAPLYVKNNAGEIPMVTALKNGYSEGYMIMKQMNGNFGEFSVDTYSSPEIWNNSYLYEFLKFYPKENLNDILRLAVKHGHVQGFSSVILTLTNSISESRKMELLKIAIFANNIFTCSFLIGIFPNLLTASSKKGDTAMHWIARCNPPCFDAIFRSIYRSFDQITVVNKNKENPFHVAVEVRNLTFLNTFLQKNNDHEKYKIFLDGTDDQIKEALNAKNKDNLTPLELALLRRDAEISLLISDLSPLSIFSANITPKILQRTFFTGIDGSTYNTERLSLLSHSIITAETEQDCLECVKLIIEQGGDPNVPDDNGKKPAHYAFERKFTSVIDYLMQNGGLLYGINNFLETIDKSLLTDEIMENIHRHDLRANSIMELYNNEKDFLAQMTSFVEKSEKSNSKIPTSSVVVISARNIMNLSERLVDYLGEICHRLSPSSCIARGLKVTGDFATCYHAFVMVVNKVSSSIDEETQQLLNSKPEGSSITYYQFFEIPALHIHEFVNLVDRIIRATPEKHPDSEILFSALNIWKEMDRRCLNEMRVFQTFKATKIMKMNFATLIPDTVVKFPAGSILLWQGDVVVKKFPFQDGPLKKLFSKENVRLYLFNTIVWFASTGPKLKNTVFYLLSTSDIFMEFVNSNLMITGKGFQFEISLVKQEDSANLENALTELEKGFIFQSTSQRIVKCFYMLEESNTIESTMMILNCSNKESAVAEFKSLNKEKIKKFSNGISEMINIVPIGKELQCVYCNIKK